MFMLYILLKFHFSPVPPPKACPTDEPRIHGANHAVVYTGRYHFLRVQFPYLYRDLRINGGLLDTIDFMMVKYDRETRVLIEEIADILNTKAGYDVIRINYLGFPIDQPAENSLQDGVYPKPYYVMFEEISRHPFDKYFKIDDDVVYIHKNTFENMVRYKDPTRCTVHFANIAGSNWRSCYIHQELSVFENTELNKEKLIFEFDAEANCGIRSLECAELALRAFVYYYHKGELYKYLFEDLHLFVGRERFSIQFMMIDIDALDLHALGEVGVITVDDEGWWTILYAEVTTHPHCIVGQSLVVHFSYSINIQELLNRNLLTEFEKIAVKEVGRKMPDEIWDKLGYE